MNCAGCGLENLPTEEACAFCAEDLGDATSRRAEWAALSPRLRDEFSQTFERALKARREWLEKLRRNRWRSAAGGAIVGGAVMALTHGPISEGSEGLLIALFVLDVVASGAAGFGLNALRGGETRGMLLFGAWYAVSTTLKLGLGVLSLGLGFGLFGLFGFVVMLCAGFAYGLHLSMKRGIEM